MRVLIADDEPHARARLRELLTQCAGIRVVGEAGDGEAVLDQVAREQPDLVLLDIRMPGLDGLEVARRLAALPDPPGIVFTTAFEAHALAAFDVEAIDYLLKPVRRERLEVALAKAIRLGVRSAPGTDATQTPRSRSHFSAWLGGSLRLMPVAEVRFIRAEQRYLTVVGRGEQLLLEESLRDLEDEFGARLLRIHRNTLVAPSAVAAFAREGPALAVLVMREGGERLPVSRRSMPEVRRRLQHLELPELG